MSIDPEMYYMTNVGDYLVIEITGVIATFIAEITKTKPLQMKVQESGHYAYLKYGDFIIHEQETKILQKDIKDNTDNLLEELYEKGRKIQSGLKSLGVKDDKLHYMLSDKQVRLCVLNL